MFRKLLAALILLPSLAAAQIGTYDGLNLKADPTGPMQAVRQSYLAARMAGWVVHAADDNMKCDGATNDTSAFLAVLARSRSASAYGAKTSYGMAIQMPMGRCMVDGQALTLTGNQSLDLAGYGPELTELMIRNDSDGLAITLDGSGAWLRDSGSGQQGASVRIRDLALVKTQAGEARTALTVTSNATINPGARQVVLRNVTMRGIAGTSAWLNGYRFTNTTGTLVEDLYWHVAHTTGTGTGTVGSYQTTGSFISTEHHITRSNMQGGNACYRFDGLIQGVTIDHSSCVGANYGIIGTSTDGTNDSLLVTSSHFDTKQGFAQLSGWNNVGVVNNYLLANNSDASNTWTGLAITQGARNSFTGNVVFGRASPSNTGQAMVVVSNSTALDSQVSISVTGNQASFMGDAMVRLLNQTTTASIIGNLCQSCGSMGSDARGNNTLWAANTINGKGVLQGLDGVLRVGTGAVQALLAADASGNLFITAPNVFVPGGLWIGSGSTKAVMSADSTGALTINGTGATSIPNGIQMGAGGTKTVITTDGGGSTNVTGPNWTHTGNVFVPNATAGESSTRAANTAFVTNAIATGTGYVMSTYTASGAIALTDTLSILSSSGSTTLAMTLANGTRDRQSALIVLMSATANATLAGNFDGSNQAITLTAQAAGQIKDKVKLNWSSAANTWFVE